MKQRSEAEQYCILRFLNLLWLMSTSSCKVEDEFEFYIQHRNDTNIIIMRFSFKHDNDWYSWTLFWFFNDNRLLYEILRFHDSRFSLRDFCIICDILPRNPFASPKILRWKHSFPAQKLLIWNMTEDAREPTFTIAFVNYRICVRKLIQPTQFV